MTESDEWIRQETHRFWTIKGAIDRLSDLHHDLQSVFADVVRAEGSWPFWAIRQVQAYHEPNDWSLLLGHPDNAPYILDHHKERVDHMARALASELLGEAGTTLKTTCGSALKDNPATQKSIEGTLWQAAAVLDGVKGADDLRSYAQMARTELESMVTTGDALSEFGSQKIDQAERKWPHPQPLEPKSKFRIAEHWTGLANAQISLMKTALALDYGASRHALSSSRMDPSVPLDNNLTLDVPPLRRTFVETDAQAHRDLTRAGESLYGALTP